MVEIHLLWDATSRTQHDQPLFCLFVCLFASVRLVFICLFILVRGGGGGGGGGGPSLCRLRAPHTGREPSVEELDPEALPILKLLWF
jgi:hypothetical protein